MKKFIITDDGFGNPGPFHAESAEALADQMLPTLELKSYEAEQRWKDNNFFDDVSDGFDREAYLTDLRFRFIAALKEVN